MTRTSASKLVTGAGGFIGRHLVRHLAARGHRVSGLGHGHWPDAMQSGLTCWRNGEIDSGNIAMLAKAVQGFDTIYHLAGGSAVAPSLAAPQEDFQRSVGTVVRLLDWMRLHAPGCRLVLVSSAAVYGANAPAPVPEDSPCAPVSPYGVHKLAAEREAAMFADQFGLHVSIARLFSVYGPGLRKQLLWDLCTRLAAGEAPLLLSGTGAEQRDWLNVVDAVDLLERMEAVASPLCPVVNGGSGEATTIARIAELVASHWPGPPAVDFSGVTRPGDPPLMHADISAARALGFVPRTDLADGIAGYVDWFRRQAG